MQRPAQVAIRGGERTALAALSWLVLGGSIACALLSVRGFVAQAQRASGPASVAAAGEPGAQAAPAAAVSAAPPSVALAPLRRLEVAGTVRSEEGEPIAGARAEVDLDPARSLSGPSGTYTLAFMLREGRAPRLRFSARGYEETEVRLGPEAIAGFEEVVVDVALPRSGSRATVSGVLRDGRGQPIAGETVQLQGDATGARYADVSDDAGAFSIPRVRVGSGYDLIVRPRGAYADHWRQDFTVPESGVALELVLEPLETRRIEGRMVDEEGRPVPGFGLAVRGEGSRERVVIVQGDAQGRFAADGVPAGALHFASLSAPYHVIRGVQPGEAGSEIEIVVDAGERQLSGRVVDAAGRPVAGAQLDLAWLHQKGALRSSSVRRSTSGPDGAFRFDGLGPGAHRLTALAAEQRVPSRPLEIAAGTGEVEIRLEAARP